MNNQFIPVSFNLLELKKQHPNLKGNSLLVLVSIMKYFPNMYPSVKKICESSGLHRQTVHKHLNILENLKIIKRFRRNGVSSLYQIHPILLIKKTVDKAQKAFEYLKNRWENRPKNKFRTTSPNSCTKNKDTIQKEIDYLNRNTNLDKFDLGKLVQKSVQAIV